MSATAGERVSTPGTAQSLPPGRLAAFEDDDDVDLGAILQPRARQRSRTDGAPDVAAAAAPEVVEDITLAPGTVTPAPARPRRAGPVKATTTKRKSPAPAETAVPEAAPSAQNRIRSTTVHIPASLIDRVIDERNRSGRSNGEIVIAAIEHAHPQLQQLVGAKAATGGGLFAARASRVPRAAEEHLTPFNVRLYEADYVILDDLVSTTGARSRGHLISVALTAYLERRP